MATVHDKLDALADTLSRKGDDAQRLELVQRARRFKRSWLEMAEGLLFVRDTRAYERWGYADLHAYCKDELHIRGATVDKLLGGYATLREHAPQVLQRDGVAQPIPTIEAVDYFAQAIRPENDTRLLPAAEPTEEVIRDLRHAVFDENKPVAVLRREFNALLHPKPEGADALERMERANAQAKRLAQVLPQIDDLSPDVAAKAVKALERVTAELDELVEAARERIYPARATA